MGFRLFLRLGTYVLLMLQATISVAADVSTLWLQDQKQLKRIDLSTNQYVQTISLPRTPEGIIFDARTNVVWALSNKQAACDKRRDWKSNFRGRRSTGQRLFWGSYGRKGLDSEARH